MGRKLGETEMLLKAAEKTARRATRGGKLWKLVALAEAGLIVMYIVDKSKEKKKEETIIEDDFFHNDEI